MVQHRDEQVYRPAFKVYARRRLRGSVLLWELRRTWTWLWLGPLLIIIGAFLASWSNYQAELHAPVLSIAGVSQRIKAVLDYASPLRTTLELFLPIVSVFLATDILLKEWRRGTLALLATRRSVLWFFALRFGYLLSYLILLTVIAILLSWWLTPIPQTDVSVWVWLWQTLLTVLAPTLLLMALGLLMAHLTVSTIASYIVPACCWLADWLFALQVEQTHSTNVVLSYLLFGWSDKDLTPYPDAWLPGKVYLCLLALLLLSIQPLLLQRVALQRKDVE